MRLYHVQPTRSNRVLWFLEEGAGLTDELPNISAYLTRLEARPARQRATAIAEA